MKIKQNTFVVILSTALVALLVPLISIPNEIGDDYGSWTAFKRTGARLEIIETDRRGATNLAKKGYEVERTSTYQLTGDGTTDSGKSPDEETLYAPAPPEAAPTGVRVAVIDSGVNVKHPWLKNNIVAIGDLTGAIEDPWGSAAAEDPDKNEMWFDGIGHGTHVAGIIRQNYPSVQIVVAKALNNSGLANDPWIARAITWAVDMDVDVINLSLGGISNSRVMREAVDLAVSRGIIVVAAAGNSGHDGSPTFYPAAWPGVVAVAAVDETGEATYFSNRGDYIDIAAEGSQIVSASRAGGLVKLSGTSMAAPKVAAVLAKIRAERSDWSAQQVIDHVLGTAKDAGAPGPDPVYGHGIVDPVRASDTSEAKTPAGAVTLAKPAFRFSTKRKALLISDLGGNVAQLRISYMYGRHEIPADVPLNLDLNCFCFGPQNPEWSISFKEQTTFVLRAVDSQGAPYLPVAVKVSPNGKTSIVKFSKLNVKSS